MRIPKDPDAVLDYSVNWARWLDGDEILSSEWIIPEGLSKVIDNFTETKATVWISGGTAGASYTITNRITTAAGRTEDRSLTVYLKER